MEQIELQAAVGDPQSERIVRVVRDLATAAGLTVETFSRTYLIGSALSVIALGSQGIVYFREITLPYLYFALGFCVALVVYYLVWKYLVGLFLIRCWALRDLMPLADCCRCSMVGWPQ